MGLVRQEHAVSHFAIVAAANTLAQILTEKRRLKALALDGVVPSIETIADGRYRLKKELLLVTGPKSSPAAQRFVAFVRSPAAQGILRQNGYWVK